VLVLTFCSPQHCSPLVLAECKHQRREARRNEPLESVFLAFVAARCTATPFCSIVMDVTLAARPPVNSDELLERVDELGLSRVRSEILERSASSLRLVPGKRSDPSFFGEPTAMPTGFVRPSSGSGPLSCVLCVRLDAIATDAARHGLPTAGWLVFLVALSSDLALGEGAPFNDGAAAVVHLADVSLSPSDNSFAGEFQRVAFQPIKTIPDPEIAMELWHLSPAELEGYESLYLPQSGATPGPPPHALHYLFGHHAPVRSSGLPDSRQPPSTLVAQIELHEAIGTEVLSRPRLLFFAERGRPLETLDVHVES
jgi:hypothetical protein